MDEKTKAKAEALRRKAVWNSFMAETKASRALWRELAEAIKADLADLGKVAGKSTGKD